MFKSSLGAIPSPHYAFVYRNLEFLSYGSSQNPGGVIVCCAMQDAFLLHSISTELPLARVLLQGFHLAAYTSLTMRLQEPSQGFQKILQGDRSSSQKIPLHLLKKKNLGMNSKDFLVPK